MREGVKKVGFGCVVFLFLLVPVLAEADEDFGEGDGVYVESPLPLGWEDSDFVSEAAEQRMIERHRMHTDDETVPYQDDSEGEDGAVGESDNLLPLDPLPGSLDADGDGLTDGDELRIGTNVNSRDTDGDGYIDGLEVYKGYNPLIKSPQDKISWVEAGNYKGLLKNEDYLITDVRIENSGGQEKLVVTGTGPEYSMVTVFIFSDQPGILIDRTDATGRFRIESGMSLATGDHRAYVGKVDAAGQLITGGPEVKFVKKEDGIKMVRSSISPNGDSASERAPASVSWKAFFPSIIVPVAASAVVVLVALALFSIKVIKSRKNK